MTDQAEYHGVIRSMILEFADPRIVRNPRAVLCAWTRRLATVVGDHSWPLVHRYPEKVRAWAAEIIDASDDDIAEVCRRIMREVEAIDYDDGWPTDRAGNALVAVCLGCTIGLERPEHTRWPAEAGQKVWRFATGANGHNDVIRFSQKVWLREAFAAAVADAR